MRGRAEDSKEEEEGWGEPEGEEKKRKAKATAAERATQVVRRREMKTMVVAGLWGELAEEEGEESVSKESRAADGFAESSSWEGSGVGFVDGVKIDNESEPMFWESKN